MDYKNKLQTNNTALKGNDLNLQTILNTIIKFNTDLTSTTTVIIGKPA